MPERSVLQQERRLLRDLARLVADRAAGEESLRTRWKTGSTRAEREFERISEAAAQRFEQKRVELEASHQRESAAAKARFEALLAPAQRRMERHVAAYNARTTKIAELAKLENQEALWLAETIVESGESKIRNSFELVRKAVESRERALGNTAAAADQLLEEYRLGALPQVDDGAEGELPESREACLKQLEESRQRCGTAYLRLRSTIAPPILQATAAWGMVISAAIAGAAAAWYFTQQPPDGAAMAGGISAVVMLVLIWVARKLIRRRAPGRARRLAEELAHGRDLAKACMDLAEADRELETAELQARRAQEIDKAEKRLNAARREIARRTTIGLPRLREIHSKRLRRLREHQLQRQQELDRVRDEGLASAEQERAETVQRAAEARDRVLAELGALDSHEREIFVNAWKDGMARLHEEVEDLQRFGGRFPGWEQLRQANFGAIVDLPEAVSIGELAIDMAALPGGLPQDEDFQIPGPMRFELPAPLDFLDVGSLLVKAPAAERERAISVLNAAMLRILTALPPGKARFTIIDPVGLGESFAGFMHLADHEEALVSNKIWTEPRHIEQRLTDLTEHMETVIQKYLRNEYDNIRDYNRDAGEIAEPLRILVFADFPANLNEAAAKRLASIISSGPRCGVYTLIAAEIKGKLPAAVPMAELERASITLKREGSRWEWQDEDFGRWPLRIDEAPAEALLTELVHRVGRAAKDTTRVQVPFEAIVPQNGELWSLSSAEEIRVPLGRSGAKKLQFMTLGRGTAQHALVAGRTGSGKSTLFHVLITSLGLWYSPDEIELYLVDFKKGVEFKTYATHRLPHARVIAVESEREFGLSVLRRLDVELTRRGALFREAGVQDMAGYRRYLQANSERPEGSEQHRDGSWSGSAFGGPTALGSSGSSGASEFQRRSLPRILFVVDEFQEFFVEDDKIAQEAALLLDRLVRQGRAFGMHVVLGSQTLGGAYSIARSTIGQMAVRVALQCSEADSYLIMSEDNAAPRLLSRPGEAIYNDASGMVEGNSPFQIVWLPDDKRDVFLDQIDDALVQRHLPRPPAPVVFEGNVPADLSGNHLLEETLSGRRGSASAPLAWLGEAISIKDPTHVAFKRQSGSNLLIVGQQEDALPPMLTAIMLALAAQRTPDGAGGMYLLDATADEVTGAALLKYTAGQLGARMGGVRDTGGMLAALADELARREAADPAAAAPPSLFLIINGLQRFRDLRKGEDYSFSMDEKPQTPAQHLAQIIRDGPTHGIHVIAWVDTMNNLERALERNLLREFDNRALFQMSGTDSTHLIESPAAAHLGRYRALLYREELGAIEKFRPYAPPQRPWVDAALAKLAGRSSPAASH